MKILKTLMIVDDDDIFVFLTKKAIDKTTYFNDIIVFSNGLDSIEYIKENFKNPDLLPEVILLDLSMPIMDGWQFLEEYAEFKSQIGKVIVIYVVTSSISPEDLKKAKNIEDVSDFIVKPITSEKLAEVIKELQVIL